MLRGELGEAEPTQRVELDEVALAAPRALPTAIADAVGPPGCSPPTSNAYAARRGAAIPT